MDGLFLKPLSKRTLLEPARSLLPDPFKTFQKKGDQAPGGSITRYSAVIFFFIVLMLALNVLDSLFTLMILDVMGKELNPVVRSAIDLYGDHFWIWKFAVVSLSIVLLCLNSKFKVVKGVIVSLSSIYLTVVLYQVFLLTHY
jgi:hypothetical protein